MTIWLEGLKRKLRGNLHLGRYLGKDFFLVKADL